MYKFSTSSLFSFWCKEFWINTLIILLIVYILRKSEHIISTNIALVSSSKHLWKVVNLRGFRWIVCKSGSQWKKKHLREVGRRKVGKLVQNVFMIRCFDIVNENFYFVVNKVVTKCSNHAIGWNRPRDLFQPIAWLLHFVTTLFATKYKFSFTMSKHLIATCYPSRPWNIFIHNV